MRKVYYSAALVLFLILNYSQLPISAQGNPTCPTRPTGDSSNACASTAFVHNFGNTLVTSVFGRTGAVVAALGDYTAALITYLAPGTGGVTITQGKVNDQFAYASMYNIKCDGSTDDTTALIQGIATATSLGKTLVLPAGTCNFSILGTIPANAHIIGQGPGQTTLTTSSTTGTLFTLANDNFTIENLRILGGVTRTAGSVAFEMSGNGAYNFNNIHSVLMGISFRTPPGGSASVSFAVKNSLIFQSVVNGADFDLSNCFICFVSDTNAFHNPAARPFAHFILRNVTGQLQLLNINFDQAGYGVYMNPGAGQVVTLVKANVAYLDSNPNGSIVCAPTSTGIIQRVIVQNSWLTNSSTGLVVDCPAGGSTSVSQISIDNTEMASSATGNNMQFTSVNTIQITNNRFAAAVGSNVLVTNGTNGSFTGNLLNGATGVTLAGTADYMNVFYNMLGSVTTPVTDGSTGTHNRTTTP